MKTTRIAALLLLLASSCQFNESVSKNLTNGLTTKGKGLSCTDVSLRTTKKEAINRTVFLYGEEIVVHFENVEGFQRTGKEAFPGMEIVVTNRKGDTVLYNPDLYADYDKPITLSPLALDATLSMGTPIVSNGSYTLKIHLWDKKGTGTFDAQLDFTTSRDQSIHNKATGMTFNELYLFDQQENRVITDGIIPPEHQIHLVYEGLKGFNDENGMCHIGVSMIAKDRSGREVIHEDDLLNDQPIESSVISTRMNPNFIFHNGERKNPITMEVVIWDKTGTARIETTVKLELR